MNMETNNTCAACAPVPIDSLVANHISALAEHDRLFQLSDWALVENSVVSAAVPPIDHALIAICKARPSSEPEYRLRRSYLISVLPDYLEDSKARANYVLEALL